MNILDEQEVQPEEIRLRIQFHRKIKSLGIVIILGSLANAIALIYYILTLNSSYSNDIFIILFGIIMFICLFLVGSLLYSSNSNPDTIRKALIGICIYWIMIITFSIFLLMIY